jgi:hypothetical protein
MAEEVAAEEDGRRDHERTRETPRYLGAMVTVPAVLSMVTVN